MSVRLMVRVFDLDLSSTEKLVLLAMTDHASPDGSGCYPSIDTLAKKTSLSPRSVQGAIRSMEKAGFLLRIGKAKGGRRVTTEYSIDLDSHHPIGPKTDRKLKIKGAARAPFPNEKGAKSDLKRVQLVREKGATGAQNPTCILIEPKTEPSTEPADAVAGASVCDSDRGKRELETRSPHHRRPPSEATAKPDDDDSGARVKPSPAQRPNAAPPDDPIELERQRIEKLKATALVRIEAKYPNQFSEKYLHVTFAAFQERAKKRINDASFFVTCFENEPDRPDEIAIETNAGAGPELPKPSFCKRCDRTRAYHDRPIKNILRENPNWVAHDFVDREIDVASPWMTKTVEEVAEIVLFGYEHPRDESVKAYERAADRAHRTAVQFNRRTGPFRSSEKSDGFIEMLNRVGKKKLEHDLKIRKLFENERF
jgi:helix-turn-helix protein